MSLTNCALGLTIVAAFLLPCLVAAPQNPFDPNLKEIVQNPQGYQVRGDRCEGLYVQPVSGTSSLLVASFTEYFEDFDPSSIDKLSLEWSYPATTPIRL